jgi:hypothetical protein
MQQMTREQFNQNEQVPTDFLTLDQRTHLAGLDTNRFAGDDRLHVRFFTKATMNQFRTDLEGRPIYEDLEYIEIWIPGDKSNINVRPVQLDDKMRFRKRYDDWKAGVVKQTGTPLKLMPFLTESEVEELAYFRITTAEQLANVADSSKRRCSTERKGVAHGIPTGDRSDAGQRGQGHLRAGQLPHPE